MQELRFGQALRYAIPGGLLIVTTALTYSEFVPILSQLGLAEAALLAAMSLLFGSIIQLVHRAIIYPAIYRVLLAHLVEGRWVRLSDLTHCYSPSEIEVKITESRWRFAGQKENEKLDARFGEWGAQVHFLYAAGWAVLLGVCAPFLAFGRTADLRPALAALVAGGIMVFAAWTHDRRMMLHENRIMGISFSQQPEQQRDA